jgi:hypothetical protein
VNEATAYPEDMILCGVITYIIKIKDDSAPILIVFAVGQAEYEK